jgi:hypothetical protein
MLGAFFKGYIQSLYRSYDVVGSGYKYIHYDLIDVIGYMTISLIIKPNFVTTFPLWLNGGTFVRIIESFNNIEK